MRWQRSFSLVAIFFFLLFQACVNDSSKGEFGSQYGVFEVEISGRVSQSLAGESQALTGNRGMGIILLDDSTDTEVYIRFANEHIPDPGVYTIGGNSSEIFANTAIDEDLTGGGSRFFDSVEGRVELSGIVKDSLKGEFSFRGIERGSQNREVNVSGSFSAICYDTWTLRNCN